ncbi:MAG: restriction endonuclease subunit S [Balneolaceae bacterium]|nr:restriction endonuclease subunit S [Balneolaceae bacterium]
MKKSKTPRLRFPEFNSVWSSKEVSQLLNIVSKRVDINPDTEYQEIGIRSHGKGIFYKDPVLGKELGNKRVFWIVKDAFILNIVFAWEQAIAKTTSKEVGLIASHRFPMYRPKKDAAYLDFIHYFFLTNRGKYLLEMASPGGAGRNKTLGKTRFMELSFRVPNAKEQKKVAHFLSTVDKKIQQLKRKKELLKKYKSGVIQKLFPNAGEQHPELRFKKENGDIFPDWEIKTLGDISSDASYGINSSAAEFDGKIKYLRITDIDDELQQFKPNPLTSPSDEVADKFYLKSGDLVFTRTGASTGKCYMYKPDDGNLVFAGFLIKFTLEIDEPAFIFFYSFTKQYKDWIKVYSARSGQPGINSNELKSLKLSIPSSLEQTKIVSFLDAIQKKIVLTDMQISRSQLFKKGLLQQMFV